jgi:disulfide bond formation protein DsbB
VKIIWSTALHGATVRIMFTCRKDSEKIVAMASILILGGAIPLAGAIVAQYGFHLHPCHFCLLERYPYVVAMLLGALTLLVERGDVAWRILAVLGIYALLTTAILGIVHTGIERHLLAYTGGCVAQEPADHSLEALKAAIESAPIVACDQAAVSFLGLSMATWNTLWAFFVIALAMGQFRFDRRRYVSTHA